VVDRFVALFKELGFEGCFAHSTAEFVTVATRNSTEHSLRRVLGASVQTKPAYM
jgi:hypothetical protein